MHGMIFAELKKFVVHAFGVEGWNAVVGEAGAAGKVFLPSQTYEDGQLVGLVAAASRVTGRPAGELVERFGAFIVPDLVEGYRAQIHPDWRTLELLLHTEETIHRVVRARAPGAAPPELAVERVAPDKVVIRYRSARRLCALARGIVAGIAEHYGEKVEIAEEACMLLGATECLIGVRRLDA